MSTPTTNRQNQGEDPIITGGEELHDVWSHSSDIIGDGDGGRDDGGRDDANNDDDEFMKIVARRSRGEQESMQCSKSSAAIVVSNSAAATTAPALDSNSNSNDDDEIVTKIVEQRSRSRERAFHASGTSAATASTTATTGSVTLATLAACATGTGSSTIQNSASASASASGKQDSADPGKATTCSLPNITNYQTLPGLDEPALRRSTVNNRRHRHQQQPGAYATAPGDEIIRRPYHTSTDQSMVLAPSGAAQGDHAAAAAAGLASVLAEANPVSEDGEALTEARPIDLAEMTRMQEQRQKRQLFCWGSLGIVVVAVIVVVAILAGVLVPGRLELDPENGDTSSLAPSNAPSEAPSTTAEAQRAALDLLYDRLSYYSNSTLIHLLDVDSAQAKAFDWLLHYPKLVDMPEWRKTQLFVLATFYHSFGGPFWPNGLDGDWLDYSRNECEWFASTYGYFDADGAYHDYPGHLSPCDDDTGMYHTLSLKDLQLSKKRVMMQPSIPPEITLLADSLKIISFPHNNISNTTLNDLIPSGFFSQMHNLESFVFSNNQIQGSIPTEMGLFSNLLDIAFHQNALTGLIPTELGILSNLQRMELRSNHLTGNIPTQLLGLSPSLSMIFLESNLLSGPIPKEMMQLTNVARLNLHNNALSGGLPSEFGLLTDATFLYLQDNAFTGTIPTEIGTMTNLQILVFGNNDLTGNIPLELGEITTLRYLGLANTMLSGTVPLLNPEIRIVNVSGNPLLTGDVPGEICALNYKSCHYDHYSWGLVNCSFVSHDTELNCDNCGEVCTSNKTSIFLPYRNLTAPDHCTSYCELFKPCYTDAACFLRDATTSLWIAQAHECNGYSIWCEDCFTDSICFLEPGDINRCEGFCNNFVAQCFEEAGCSNRDPAGVWTGDFSSCNEYQTVCEFCFPHSTCLGLGEHDQQSRRSSNV